MFDGSVAGADTVLSAKLSRVWDDPGVKKCRKGGKCLEKFTIACL